MQIHDSLTLADVTVTSEGFLVAKAAIARTGIQTYRAFELGVTDGDPNRVIKVNRPEEEVFSDEAMRSFERKPVTDGHPPHVVNSQNATLVTLGLTGEKVLRDQGLVSTTITLFDETAVADVTKGRRQLSAGYSADIDWTSGTTDSGEAFDAVQRNIRGNHVALVDAGRCGTECRIGDCQCDAASCSCGGHTVKDTNLTTVTHDGVSIETTDQGAQVITKLSSSLEEANKALADANTANAAAIAAKDKELGEKDSEIAKLKDAEMKPEELERLADSLAKVKSEAAAIVGDMDLSGKTIPEIRRAVVASKFGDEEIKDRSDDYIEARFAGLKPADTDPLRDALRDQATPQANGAWGSNVFDSAGVAMRKEG